MSEENIVEILEETPEVQSEEMVEFIEVIEPDVVNIEVDNAFPAFGEPNEQLKHSLLNDRDLKNQHPITAIEGLREELDSIEALKTLHSNQTQQANYYLWQDENILQEDRIGYFVAIFNDINDIKICSESDEIFGVTVDSAGFIGGQDDIARDYKYGLVLTNGVTHVRCELSVNVGDYVVSNAYGYAKKNDSGYKVVGRHKIDGIEYAEIALVAPIGIICELSDNVKSANQRIDGAEANIVSAMNMANAAYNKASEASSVSEEVLKNALEALKKSEDNEAEVDKFLDETAPNITEMWKEAQAIAESASSSAITAKDEAVKTANDAWAKSENVASEFQSLTAKIDQYSVGEYSQAYGLTLEQARAILKTGMIYIPTKHLDADTHSETYDPEGPYHFTPGNYYEWDGNFWTEHNGCVAFYSEEPTPSRALQYWYIDSNEAPEGYEAHALYIWDDAWQKVNILEGNVNNRLTSMIRQTADKIALDVVNAQGDIASHQLWLDNNSANIQDVVSWKSDVENDVSQIATIKQTADDAGASIALVVEEKDGEKVINGGSIAMAINNQTGDSIIKLNADVVDIDAGNLSLKGQTINLTADDIAITSDNFSVDKDGTVTANKGYIAGWEINKNQITKTVGENTTTLDSSTGSIISNNIITQGGTIGSWKISDNYLMNVGEQGVIDTGAVGISPGVDSANKEATNVKGSGLCFWAGAYWDSSWGTNGGTNFAKAPFRVYNDGSLYASQGTIGAWHLTSNHLYGFQGTDENNITSKRSFGIQNPSQGVYAIGIGFSKMSSWADAPFRVTHEGKLYATGAEITGVITATSGSFTGTINAGAIIADNVQMGTKAAAGNWTFQGSNLYTDGIWEGSTATRIYTTINANKIQVKSSSGYGPKSALWINVIEAANGYTSGINTSFVASVYNSNGQLQSKTFTVINGVITSIT